MSGDPELNQEHLMSATLSTVRCSVPELLLVETRRNIRRRFLPKSSPHGYAQWIWIVVYDWLFIYVTLPGNQLWGRIMSGNPESNQGPSDVCYFVYSQMLCH